MPAAPHSQNRRPLLSRLRFSAVSAGRSPWRMLIGSSLALIGLLMLPLMLWGPTPLSINLSESLPVGLYWTRALPGPGMEAGETPSADSGRPQGAEAGMLVSACLPPRVALEALDRGYLPRGPCPSGAAPVGKRIAALPGDTVDVTDSGSFVNGMLLPNSAPRVEDSRGRPMARLRGRFVLSAGTVWLYSGHSPGSFDSRYYGPVPFSEVQGQLFPLLTRGKGFFSLRLPFQGLSGGPRADARPQAASELPPASP